MKEIEILKEDIAPYVYFVCSMAQQSEGGMYGTLGGKSDYIGGIFDRWINIIPESLIFNKYFLEEALKKAGKSGKARVFSDFYKYDPRIVGIAPDVIGVQIDDKVIPFVKYDDTRPGTQFWVEQPNCPQIEVKSFADKNKMVSLRDQHYGNKYLVMVGLDLAVDYLLPFFESDFFGADTVAKLAMPNDFIISDTKDLLSQTEGVAFSKPNLGTLQLLTVTTAAEFCKSALELQGGEIPRWFVNITSRTTTVRTSNAISRQPIEYYCDKMPFGLYRFNDNWKKIFKNEKEKTLDIHIENPQSIFVVGAMSSAIVIQTTSKAKINGYDLEAGREYSINFGASFSTAGKEYFMNKAVLPFLASKEKDLIQALAIAIKKN